ncbi:MAG: outer membrane lipid asymmetry maintenance protein MlaD [Rhodobacteraceae bacterium]|jgi:phospholipid/cholesterol/gamma-HCH transport system substrate-binding protein|uniref:outer membrane lipid asymmetry maintenance protein MlaD n=1 Tax=Albidovulum sp. TaxID=1872424 RepID=UPI001D20736C|nr:outer membrane lipid asymmetry maintenance protein MlaD [uncultured Defluviimonas sp.]MCB2126914.1 outer membrane lipid asymmetry maintenance protein MlaD [Paracoccaceae bacterium]MCC0068803.1 outer membrane lipid asymmetry maintenance protein MlaD [Paracoccaceae bacterium]
MAESVTEVLTGAGVLAAAVGFLVYASGGEGLTRATDSYELMASFRSVEGITVGTDVRMAGVKVGTVTDLALNPKTFFADAKVTVRNGVAVPDDSTIVIASEGLLGGAFVEILPGGSPSDLAPGAEIEDTQGAVSVIALLMKFVGAAAGDAPETPAP